MKLWRKWWGGSRQVGDWLWWRSWSFFNAIADDNYFEDDRENCVSIGGGGDVEVRYQPSKFVTLYNKNIDAMNKEKLYAEIFA